MSRCRGAPRHVKADFGNDDSISERANARLPDPPIELSPQSDVGRLYIRRVDDQNFGNSVPMVRKPREEVRRHASWPPTLTSAVSGWRVMMQHPTGTDRESHTEEHEERKRIER